MTRIPIMHAVVLLLSSSCGHVGLEASGSPPTRSGDDEP